MKLIDIFLGSSITELKEERQAFTEIVAELNTKLKEIGYVLYLNICEHLSSHINQKKSQQLVDEMMLDCHYAYFVVKSKLGQFTLHEFETALKQFGQCGKPKLSVLFCHGSILSEEARSFQTRLQEIGYYFKEYRNKEEIKLNMILNLVIDDILLPRYLSVEDGGIYLGETKLINTGQIPIYSKHSKLCDLKQQLAILEQAGRNAEDNRRRRQIREEISGIVAQIRDIENLIYQTMLGLTKAGRGQMTPLLTRASAYLEQGNIEQAAQILNIRDVTEELNAYKDKTEISIEGLQSAIETTYIAIETMMQMPESLERTQQIETLFHRIIALEVDYNLNRKHCGLYIRYLLQRKRIDQAEKYIPLYLEAPDLRIETLQDFLQSEYALLGLQFLLEPLYKDDPKRFQKLYIRTAFSYIQMYSDALEKLDHDQMNINPHTMGLHCDRLLNTLQDWIGEKDDDICEIEIQLQAELSRLQKMGYRRVNLTKLNGESEAKKIIAQMELREACEKLNDEPQTDNPREYLEQYAAMTKELLDFFHTSDNMLLKNNPVIEKTQDDYRMMLAAIQQGGNSVLRLYAQIRISHAEHFVKVANFEIALKDYLAAYETLRSMECSDDLLLSMMRNAACTGLTVTLGNMRQYNLAEEFLLDGIEFCQGVAGNYPTLELMLARMYSNHIALCMNGRLYDCINKSLYSAQKAYRIFDARRNVLSEEDIISFVKLCLSYGGLLTENGKDDEAYPYLLEALDLFNGLGESTVQENYGLIEPTIALSLRTGMRLQKLEPLKERLEAMYGARAAKTLLNRFTQGK